MLQKNIDKQKRKERKTWAGLYTRKTQPKKNSNASKRVNTKGANGRPKNSKSADVATFLFDL